MRCSTVRDRPARSSPTRWRCAPRWRHTSRPPGRSKIRDHAALDAALTQPEIASRPVCGAGPLSDHAADALLTAAWLRRAATRPALWRPDGLDAVADTEGWTFGAV